MSRGSELALRMVGSVGRVGVWGRSYRGIEVWGNTQMDGRVPFFLGAGVGIYITHVMTYAMPLGFCGYLS